MAAPRAVSVAAIASVKSELLTLFHGKKSAERHFLDGTDISTLLHRVQSACDPPQTTPLKSASRRHETESKSSQQAASSGFSMFPVELRLLEEQDHSLVDWRRAFHLTVLTFF